jgi:hypothetical protein
MQYGRNGKWYYCYGKQPGIPQKLNVEGWRRGSSGKMSAWQV